jgi:hypothetical protein
MPFLTMASGLTSAYSIYTTVHLLGRRGWEGRWRRPENGTQDPSDAASAFMESKVKWNRTSSTVLVGSRKGGSLGDCSGGS